jgi:hypothetical protein
MKFACHKFKNLIQALVMTGSVYMQRVYVRLPLYQNVDAQISRVHAVGVLNFNQQNKSGSLYTRCFHP